MRTRALRGVALSVSILLAATSSAVAIEPTVDGGFWITADELHEMHHQHGEEEGHLDPSQTDNIRLVGKAATNQDFEGRVADVGVLNNHAYLAAWAAPSCQKGGVYVFDINNPAKPKQVNFIRTGLDSYSGEGIQAIHLSTAAFTGDVLAFNNEDCTDNAGNTSKHSHGGFTLVDVSSPKNHKYLVEGFGDHDTATLTNEVDAHEIHSIFVWEDDQGTTTDADDRAYAVVTDNEDAEDVDIFDITNPRQPSMVGEWDLNVRFPQIIDSLGTAESFLHDMIVKEIDGRDVMLLSYWDGGYVQLDVDDPTDPDYPAYIVDSNFETIDPVLEAATGAQLPPEGNAHQAEFTRDNQYVVATDEDFNAHKPFLSLNGGASTPFSAGVPTEGVPFEEGDEISGPTRYLGRACAALAPAGPGEIAVIERGDCDFQVKLNNASAAGYVAAFIFNNKTSVPNCEGLLGMIASTSLPAFFVSRSVGFSILGIGGYDASTCPSATEPALPAAGAAGQAVHLSFKYDGWGYVHLYDAQTMEDLDTYSIPEAHDPQFADGFGDLSIHEVAASERRDDLVYFAYYSAGLRVARIVDNELVEVGHFIDADGHGNNFWGVQVWQKDGKEYVLASDRDFGLYIFEYTGAGGPNR
jgi:hypothetical protein